MDKTTIAVFILAFWLILPLPLTFMELSKSNVLEEISVPEEPSSLLDYIAFPLELLITFGKMLWIYLKIMLFTIPNIPPLLDYFIFFLRWTTFIIAIIIIKE